MSHDGTTVQAETTTSPQRRGRTRRSFTPEFKLEAVRLAGLGDRPASAIARDPDIRPEMLRQWTRPARTRAVHRGTDVFPGDGKLISRTRRTPRTVALTRPSKPGIATRATLGDVGGGHGLDDSRPPIRGRQHFFPSKSLTTCRLSA